MVDPSTGRPTRVVYMYTPEGQRVRVRRPEHAGVEPTVNDILPTPPEHVSPEEERRAARAGLGECWS